MFKHVIALVVEFTICERHVEERSGAKSETHSTRQLLLFRLQIHTNIRNRNMCVYFFCIKLDQTFGSEATNVRQHFEKIRHM